MNDENENVMTEPKSNLIRIWHFGQCSLIFNLKIICILIEKKEGETLTHIIAFSLGIWRTDLQNAWVFSDFHGSDASYASEAKPWDWTKIVDFGLRGLTSGIKRD